MIRGLAWAMLVVVCWAPMFSVAKRAFPYVDAFGLGTIRYALGVLLLIAVLWAVEGAQALRYEGRLRAAVGAGLLGITGFNGLVWFGLSFSRPEHSSIILAMQTPMIALAAWFLYGQRPRFFTIACIVLAITGVLLVVTKGDLAHAFEGGSLFGDLLIVAGALCWVGFTLLSARFKGWSPLRFTVLTCIPGGIGVFVVNVLAVWIGIASVPEMDAVAAIGWQIAYFVVFSVFLGVLAFNQSVRHFGALNTMLMLNLIPVCVFAIEAWLGRSFSAIEIGGAAVVIGALVANNLYLRLSAKVKA
jgi:drug/metabolite transporter (DMT)-like permease